MKLLSTHMTSGKSNGRALCGRRLRFVKWVEDRRSVDCDNCLESLMVAQLKKLRLPDAYLANTNADGSSIFTSNVDISNFNAANKRMQH